MTEIEKVHGIYFLYDENKDLVYVGKSRMLGARLPVSIRSNNATFYEYARTKTLSDMSVYELYYIAKLKPVSNSDCKYSDELTIELDCIRNFEVKDVFEEVGDEDV